MTIAEFESQWRDRREYIEAFTSGSTGQPKAIRLPKSDMVQSACQTNEFFGIDSNSRLVLPLSIDHIAGKMMAVRAFVAGCELVIVEPSNRVEWAGSCDLMSVVPSQVPWLIEHPEWSSRIKNLLVGGAALAQSLKEQLVMAGYHAYVSYGMTETCSHVALSAVGEAEEPYEAMPSISFALDPRGCLVVNAPEFTFGQLTTNDVVELIDDRHFYWLGRYDNVINSGGLKIHPEVVERALARFIDDEFYIVGVKDEKWGEAVSMVVEGSSTDMATRLRKMRESVDHRILPKKIWVVNGLERTYNGKIKRISPEKLDVLSCITTN